MTTSNREWLRRQVEAEDGGFVSVGGFVMAIEQLSAEHATVKPLRQAFARLVQLKRRESALSIEQFAERVDVDLREVVGIETDDRYTPTGLCVHRIASFFKLPERPLMEGRAVSRCFLALRGAVSTSRQALDRGARRA